MTSTLDFVIGVSRLMPMVRDMDPANWVDGETTGRSDLRHHMVVALEQISVPADDSSVLSDTYAEVLMAWASGEGIPEEAFYLDRQPGQTAYAVVPNISWDWMAGHLCLLAYMTP